MSEEARDKPDERSKPERDITAPSDAPITDEDAQKTVLEHQDEIQQNRDNMPSGIQEAAHQSFGIIDSIDSPSIQQLEALDTPESEQFAEIRNIRKSMPIGPARDRAETEARQAIEDVMKQGEQAAQSPDLYDAGTHQAISLEQPEPQLERNTVTVAKGDTLWGISRRDLGKDASNHDVAMYVKEITRINQIQNPDLIYPGQVFELPTLISPEGNQAKPHDPDPIKPARNSDALGPVVDTRKNESQESPPDNNSLEKFQSDNTSLQNRSAPEKKTVATQETDTSIDKASENIERTTIDHLYTKEVLLKIAEDRKFDVNDFRDNLDEVAKRVSKPEIEKFHQQIGRLLDTKSSVGVSIDNRGILARQILEQAADPTKIEQGRHETCSVNTVETRLYYREPSKAARFVTELALTGMFTTEDDQSISVEIDPRFIDNRGRVYPADDIRSYASEIFQTAAVNLHYSWTGEPRLYRPKVDSDELIDTTDKHLVSKKPDLDDNQISNVYKLISGDDSSDEFVVIHRKDVVGSSQGLNLVDSEKDLRQALLHLKNTGQLPSIVGVHTGNDPFWSDKDNLRFKGNGHFVSVIDIQEDGMVLVDNQWRKRKDHVKHPISCEELYFSMQSPQKVISEYETRVLEKRSNPTKVEGRMEFELIRLKRLANVLSNDVDSETEIVRVMREQQSRWKQEEEGGTLRDEERDKALHKLDKIIYSLNSSDVKIRLRAEQNTLGLLSDKDYTADLIAYGRFAKNLPDKTPSQLSNADKHLDQLSTLVNQLPGEQAVKIANQIAYEE